MYAQDSFFTLTPGQQLGLLALSGAFAAITLAFAALGLRRLPRGLAVVGAAAVIWAFAWLSPQGYYQYYRLIIDGLPAQWVIGAPPGLRTLGAVLSFQGPGTLSAHSLGALGWTVIIVATIRR